MLYKEALTLSPAIPWTPPTENNTSRRRAGIETLVKPHPECVFLRTRAIGNLEVDGPNSNFDAFPYSEFINEKLGFGYQSFKGKKAFIEHASDSVSNSIGDLLDSYLNKFNLGSLSSKVWHDLNDSERLAVIGSFLKNDRVGSVLLDKYTVSNSLPEQNDGSIEVLMRIDRQRAPKIARQVDLGENVGVSMGTAIAFSDCSVCGNRAYYEKEYCDHIAYGKGRLHTIHAHQLNNLMSQGTMKPEWLRFVVQNPSEVRAVLEGDRRMVQANAFEINYGLQFYELSVVATPAYGRGYMLEKVAKKQNLKSSWINDLPDTELLALAKEFNLV
jgi:hypothetical protein